MSKPYPIYPRPATVRPTAARVAHASPDAHARATGPRVPRHRARRVVPVPQARAPRSRRRPPAPRPRSRPRLGARPGVDVRAIDRVGTLRVRERAARGARAARRDRDVRRRGVGVRGGRPPVPRPRLRHERRALRGGGRARRRGGGDEREVSPHRGRRQMAAARPSPRAAGRRLGAARSGPCSTSSRKRHARVVSIAVDGTSGTALIVRGVDGEVAYPPCRVQRATTTPSRRVVRAGGAHHAQRQLGAVQLHSWWFETDGGRVASANAAVPRDRASPCPTRVCCTTRTGWRFCCTARWA